MCVHLLQVEALKTRLHGNASNLQVYEQYLHLTSLACCAAAVVHCGCLPPKLNQIIQPLMAAVSGVCCFAVLKILIQCTVAACSLN